MAEVFVDAFGAVRVQDHGHFTIVRDPDAAAIVFQVDGTDASTIVAEFPDADKAEEVYDSIPLVKAKRLADIIAIIHLEMEGANS